MMRTRLLIALVIFALAAQACGGGGVDLPPAANDAQPPANSTPPAATAPPRDANQPPERLNLVWGPGWTLRIRPIFSGVPLRGSEGTVIVEAWEDGPAAVRYAFPEARFAAVTREVAQASTGLLRPAPAEGLITVPAARARERVLTPPAFWQGGEATAPGPLLWLPSEALTELRHRRPISVRLAPLPNGLRMRGTAAPDPGPVELKVVNSDFAILPVNGKPIRLPALRLTDGQGGTYVVLDAVENPLVLQFRFSPDAVVAGRKLTTAAGGGYDVIAMDQGSWAK
jgi:hypothetical protein